MADNTITEIGRLVDDPSMKFTNGGKAVVTFSLAVEKAWTNRQTQEREKKVSFFNVIVWDQLGEHVANSLKKGYRVFVTGALEQKTWETDAGEKRSMVQIVADGVGPDLRFVNCTISQTERGESGGRSSQAAPSGQMGFDEDPF